MANLRLEKPGLWERGRGVNWYLAAIVVGLILLWLAIVYAVVWIFG